MGGTGGGGSFSSSDMQRIQDAANERLKAIASKSTKVLFVCEALDRKSLDAQLTKSSVFKPGRYISIDGSEAAKVDSAIDTTTFIVAYTNGAKVAAFVDVAIDKALVKKIGGVHVKGGSKAIIPSKITANRMRSITWRELETIFK